jgi:hypothetical protein
MSLWSSLFGKRNNAIEFAETGSYGVEVVGESNYQKNLKSLCGGYSKESQRVPVTATLVHEDENPHDNKAVRIDVGKRTVGYLCREDARKYRKYLKKSGHQGRDANCAALIVGGWNRGRQDRGSFGIFLDLSFA